MVETKANKLVRLGAQKSGVEVHERCPVTKLLQEDGRVVGVETERGLLHTDRVVLAAGAWSRKLAATVGAQVKVVIFILLQRFHLWSLTWVFAKMLHRNHHLGEKLAALYYTGWAV